MTESQILIAEDEKIVALDIQDALRNSRYAVAGVASTGRDAVRLARDTRPDLVLMDIRLKGDMDGVQAAEQIRSTYNIPVVYLTAHSDEHTVQRAKVTQPYGYLLKPFEKAELHTTIEMALHKHRMEKALHENREWLWAILNGTGDALLTTDTRGLVTFINPVASALTGWTAPEALGRPWLQVVQLVDEPRGAPLPALAGVLEGGMGAGFPGRTALVSRDGARRPVDGNAAAVRNNRGEVTGAVLVFRDITERRRLEDQLRTVNESLEERVRERTAALSRANEQLTHQVAERLRTEAVLQESESRFRSIAQTTPDGVFLTDHRGRLIFSNRSLQRIFGHGEKECLNKNVVDLVTEPLRPRLQEILRELIAPEPHSRVGQLVNLRGLDKAAREFPLELSLSTWESGGARFYAGIARDVTERRLAEANLKFQAGILAQVKDAIIAVDDHHRVIYLNRGTELFYGRRLVEVMGREVDGLVTGAWMPAETRAAVEAALVQTNSWRGPLIQKKMDGTEIHVRMSVTGLKNDAGAPMGWLMVVQDETERKQLESFLLHSEKLASMGQMAAAVAHELKTPLGVIFSYADLLPLQAGEEREFQATLDNIKRQIFRCSNLVDNLLDFSRKRAPGQDERVEVKEMMSSAMTLIEPYALGKSIRIDKDFSFPALSVAAAKGLLEQVIINLAVNAIEAMPEGGTLSLRTRATSAPDGSAGVEIQVSDTGSGIRPEALEHIFEPFYSAKASGRGTGLGLWLAREILSSLNGKIDCLSHPGQGTVFTVLLPAKKVIDPQGEAS